MTPDSPTVLTEDRAVKAPLATPKSELTLSEGPGLDLERCGTLTDERDPVTVGLYAELAGIPESELRALWGDR